MYVYMYVYVLYVYVYVVGLLRAPGDMNTEMEDTSTQAADEDCHSCTGSWRHFRRTTGTGSASSWGNTSMYIGTCSGLICK